MPMAVAFLVLLATIWPQALLASDAAWQALREDAQTQAVRQRIGEWRSRGVLVMVTHQVNITALTGIFPEEGEALVLKPKAGTGFDLIGRIRP